MRARRVKVPDEIRALDALEAPGYADAFEAMTGGSAERSAEAWARSVFEELSGWQQLLLVLGGRLALGFRPGPPGTGHVLGWRITDATPGRITLEQHSRLLVAHLVLRATGTRLVLVTVVRRRNLAGKLIWTAAAPVHRWIALRAMHRAVLRR